MLGTAERDGIAGLGRVDPTASCDGSGTVEPAEGEAGDAKVEGAAEPDPGMALAGGALSFGTVTQAARTKLRAAVASSARARWRTGARRPGADDRFSRPPHDRPR